MLATIRSKKFAFLSDVEKCKIQNKQEQVQNLSLTLRETHRLKVFEYRVPRRISGQSEGALCQGKCDGQGWTDLAQDKDQWKALVNTIINLWVP
jgi:hypothetical protein